MKNEMIIGVYCHVPEGIDDSSFEHIYLYCYRPLISVLNKFPDINMCLYFSGTLLELLEKNHSEYPMLVKSMINRRQIEQLGGAYYSPLMPLLSNADKTGQIELLTTYSRRSFGKRPRGCWLQNYAWEPTLASVLNTAGMNYTFLSDSQFIETRGLESDSFSPVLTEDQGRTIVVFPVHDFPKTNDLSFTENLQEYFVDRKICTFMFSGEKIEDYWKASGLASPDLFLEQTFASLRSNLQKQSIKLTLPSKYLKNQVPTNILYFPDSASKELMKYCLKTKEEHSIGSVRQLLINSYNSFLRYSKMYYITLLINSLKGDKTRKNAANEELWGSQCGDAFWHSPFLGIENPAIRSKSSSALICAETTFRQKGIFKQEIVKSDIDFNRKDEYLFQGNDLNVYVNPVGASIFEIDALKTKKNLSDIYTYGTLPNTSHHDSFIDRIYQSQPSDKTVTYPWESDISGFNAILYKEINFESEKMCVKFQAENQININGEQNSFTLRKNYCLQKKIIRVSYELENTSSSVCSFWFATELNLAIIPSNLESIDFGSTNIVLPLKNSVDLGIDGKLSFKSTKFPKNISVLSSMPVNISLSPIYFEYEQGITALLYWKIDLNPNAIWQTDIQLNIQNN